jgi:hypothetical protein
MVGHPAALACSMRRASSSMTTKPNPNRCNIYATHCPTRPPPAITTWSRRPPRTTCSEALAPEKLLSPQRHASSAACPGCAWPRHALLPSTAACGRRVLGEPPTPRADGGSGEAKMPFDILILILRSAAEVHGGDLLALVAHLLTDAPAGGG